MRHKLDRGGKRHGELRCWYRHPSLRQCRYASHADHSGQRQPRVNGAQIQVHAQQRSTLTKADLVAELASPTVAALAAGGARIVVRATAAVRSA